MKTYVVLDTERRYDKAAHARYQQSERFDPSTMSHDLRDNHELITPRWILQEITAISWMSLSNRDGEALTPLAMHSHGLPETDEKGAIKAFFDFIAHIVGDVVLVTWGGLNAEIPMLLSAAATHQLALPPRLKALAAPRRQHDYPHIDLMRIFCADAPRVHLAEIAARNEIPAKLSCKPDQVSRLMEQGKWAQVKAVCEGDVLTTAGVLARYLHMRGEAASSLVSDIGLCRYVRQNLGHRDYAANYAAWEQKQEAKAYAGAKAKE